MTALTIRPWSADSLSLMAPPVAAGLTYGTALALVSPWPAAPTVLTAAGAAALGALADRHRSA